jgi:chromosome segregation ATPase
MVHDSDRVPGSDYAFLEGRLLRVESEQKSIRRIHGQLADEVERLAISVRKLSEARSHFEDPYRETTDVRNQRRVELESLRVRAKDAERAEIELMQQRTKFTKQLVLLVPAFGAALYAIAEFIRSFAHHAAP